MKVFVRSIFALVWMLLFAAHASALDKLVVQNGSPVPSAAYLDFYVADKAGFFKEEGVEIEMRYSQGAPQATQIAASNGADVGLVAYEPFLSGYSSGMRGKFIFNSYDYNIFFMAVPEDSPIKTVADLAGKTIGVTNMGSGSLIVARSMLRGAGIDPKPSVFLPVGFGDSAMQALKSGKVQALSLWDGGYAGLERAGMKLRYLHHPTIGFIGNGGLLVSEKSLAENREALVKMVRALVKSRIFIHENFDAALKLYWQANPAAKKGATDQEAYEMGMSEIKFMSPYLKETPIEKIGRFDLPGLEKYFGIMKQEEVLKADLKPAAFATNELLDQIGSIDVAAVKRRAKEWK